MDPERLAKRRGYGEEFEGESHARGGGSEQDSRRFRSQKLQTRNIGRVYGQLARPSDLNSSE